MTGSRPLHAFSPFTRFQIWLTGTDDELLAQCPTRDVGNVKTVAWLLMLVWFWQTGLFTLVGHMMLARAGEFRPGNLVGAAVLASIVALLDAYVIIRSSWALQGITELQRGGLKVPGTFLARIKNGLFLLIRLVISCVMATLLAIFLSILLYQKDIDGDLKQKFLRENATLLEKVTRNVDERIEEVGKEQARLRARVGNVIEEQTQLMRIAVDPSMDDPEVKLALDRVSALTSSKGAAETELAEAQQYASDELGGVKRSARNSGKAGRGPLRRAAEERITNAQTKLAKATAELLDADAKLAGLRSALSGTGSARKLSAEARLSEAQASRAALEKRLAALEQKFKNLSESREADIQAGLQADPAYLAQDEGFLGRLKGLRRLADNDSDVKFVVIILDLFLFGIELAAVLAKSATFIPATYATMLAQADYRRAYQTAHDLVHDIEALKTRPKTTTETVPPEGVPPDAAPDAATPDDGGAAEAAPGASADLGSRLRQAAEKDAPSDNKADTGSSARTPGSPSIHEAGPREEQETASTTETPRKRGRPKGSGWRPQLQAIGSSHGTRHAETKPGHNDPARPRDVPQGYPSGQPFESDDSDRYVEGPLSE